MIKKLTPILTATAFLINVPLMAQDYDLVINNGTVMDPESGLNAIRHVGVKNGKIAAISSSPLSGKENIDATNKVVSPGFIDLHAHGQDLYSARLQAQDGVTTQLELEGGVFPVKSWYQSRMGKAPINYGATASHISVRIAAITGIDPDSTAFEDAEAIYARRDWVDNPADDKTMAIMTTYMNRALKAGALGIGFGINYTPGASREEIYQMFKMAKSYGVVNFVHSRNAGEQAHGGSMDAMQELVADAASTGAGLHVVHIGSSGLSKVPVLLEMFDSARTHGVDITTEVYPYTAASTHIGAAIFDEGFQKQLGISYENFQLPSTGAFLDETSFMKLRSEAPGTPIVVHLMREENVRTAIAHKGVIIASDGVPFINGKAHPRGAGTFARVLGRYVREQKALGLFEAVSKMTYLPAKRLEGSVEIMKHKGRIQVGMDADITVFDPATVMDRATFLEPNQPSKGIEQVLVGGKFIVKNSTFQEGQFPGEPIIRDHTH